MSGVWVFVEHANGEIKTVSREALGAAKMVAEGLGQPVSAVVFGSDVGGVANNALAFGVDSVVAFDDATFADFRVEAAGPALAQSARDGSPTAILAGGTTVGGDLLAWVAAELDAGMISDATGLAVEDGVVKVTRPVYAGKLESTVFITEGVQIFTIRSRAFPAAEPTSATGSVMAGNAVKSEDDIPTKVVGLEAKDGGVSLTDASIIVSGGRGVGGPEGFEPVKALADALGAAMGASRAAVDAGWIPYEHQVGQTGKTVSPDLYIASGISGAIQHQAGMRTSKIIVAINKDPEAPIFKLASYGIVGDLFEILPALTAEFQKRLA
jgi:electron transfer flavoprotein alpha subunit